MVCPVCRGSRRIEVNGEDDYYLNYMATGIVNDFAGLFLIVQEAAVLRKFLNDY